MILQTQRLILREMTIADYDDLYLVLADSDIMRHYPYTFDENRVRNWIEKNIQRYQTFGFGLWAVTLKENGQFIGDCGITMQNIHGIIRPEIGYHIRHDFQNQGFATEAAQCCRDYLFENTAFIRVYSYMTADNTPSRRVAQKNGMKLIDEYTDDDSTAMVAYAIQRSEWELLKSNRTTTNSEIRDLP